MHQTLASHAAGTNTRTAAHYCQQLVPFMRALYFLEAPFEMDSVSDLFAELVLFSTFGVNGESIQNSND